jgi:hypothetical protein
MRPKRGKVVWALGTLYSFWIREWDHPQFNFVQDAFDLYLSKGLTRAPKIEKTRTAGAVHRSRYEHRLTVVEQAAYMSFADAVRVLGPDVDVKTVKKLVRLRRLTTRRFGSGPAHTAIFLREAEVEELARRWRNSITQEAAALLLGVPDEAVLEMVSVWLLQAERGPSIEGSPEWAFSKEAVSTCLIKILAHAQVVQAPASATDVTRVEPGASSETAEGTARATESIKAANAIEMVTARPRLLKPSSAGQCGESYLVPIVEAAQELVVVGLTLVRLLSLIAEGNLRAYAPCVAGAEELPDTNVEALYLSRQDIAAYRSKSVLNGAWIGTEEVATRIGTPRYEVARWVRRGLLPALPAPSAVRHEYRFDPHDVDRFCQKYVLAVEAAQMLGIKPVKLCAWVRQKYLFPVSGPGIDRGILYLFRREDIEALAALHCQVA